MDPAVFIGAALVLGGLVSVAPLPVLAFALLAMAVVRASVPGARGWLSRLAWLAAAAGALRGAVEIRHQEVARKGALQALPSITRCTATAEVTGSPVEARGSLRWAGLLRDVVCDGVSSSWAGPATLYGGPADLARGDVYEVVTQLAPPERLWNEATGDPRPGEARRRVLRSGGAVDLRLVESGRSTASLVDRFRAHVRARIAATFSGDTAPMARALVLGESDLAPEDDAAFRTSGLAHLLAVSGMHLVLVIATFAAVLRGALVRIERLAARLDVERVAALLSLGLAWLYADFAGGGGSTMRAAWMMTAAYGARALGRRTSGARAFGLSLLAMAACDPLVAFDASFALSAAATGGLLAFARPFSDALSRRLDPSGGRRWVGWLTGAVGTTLAATVPCTPILARFAPTVPLGGVIANLVAVPVGEAAALPLCLVHVFLSPFPALEKGCALAGSGALGLVRIIARTFTSQRWLLVEVPPPTSWQMVLAGVALVAILVGRARSSIVLACVAGALLAEIAARRGGAPRSILRASFLDVGQGDAAILDLPDGSGVVIDGGGLVGSPIDVGARVLAPELRFRRRYLLAAAILSHPHPDHFSGLVTGLSGVRVGALWDTGQGEREGVAGSYASLLGELRGRRVPVVHPDSLCGPRAMGGAVVDVLAPCPGPSSDRGPNDNSLVVRVSYGRRAFLFVGDAESAEESDLLALGGTRLRADVLKVGHHGSRTSTSPAFLAAVHPSEAVISCGTRNRFGHPNSGTLETLAAAGVHVWRTDRAGEVIATTDGADLRVVGIAR